MAVLDFPSDTSQSPYELNGITYNWDGQKWVAAGTGGSGGGGGGDLTLQEVTDNGNTTTNYLDVGNPSLSNSCLFATNNHTNPTLYARNHLSTGSTFRGLDAGGDITIDLKADGGASFDGTVSTYNVNGGSTGKDTVAFDVGNGAGSKRFSVYPDGSLAIGGTGVHTDSSILLNGPDGSATFAGAVQVGASGGGTAAEGMYFSQLGRILITGTTGGNLWTGYEKGSSTVTSSINSNGRAEFAGGNITLGEDGTIKGTNLSDGLTTKTITEVLNGGELWSKSGTQISPTTNGDNVQIKTSDGTTTISLSNNGNISGQQIISGNNPNGGVNEGARLRPNGNLQITNDGGVAINIMNKGESGQKVSISSNGSATFAGGQTSIASHGGLTCQQDGGTALVQLTSNGSIYARGPATGGALNVINDNTGKTTFSIQGNGNTFIGDDTQDAGGTKITLNANGDATFDGTVTENASDVKFKTQTRSVPTSQLEDIKNLQLKEWNWTEDTPGNEERNNRRNRGLIAQEAELVDPNLVYEVTQDEDNSYKAIDHQVLIMKLLGAVQELSAEVQALKEAN